MGKCVANASWFSADELLKKIEARPIQTDYTKPEKMEKLPKKMIVISLLGISI